MPSIGSFGTPVDLPAEPDTFEFFGTDVRIDSAFGSLKVIDVLERWGSVEAGSSDDFVAVKAALREAIEPEDFDGFWASAIEHRQTTDGLLKIYHAISTHAAEQETERPTVLPSDSSDGLERTPLRSVPQPADPAMERLIGRPDLQSALLEARASKAARSA